MVGDAPLTMHPRNRAYLRGHQHRAIEVFRGAINRIRNDDWVELILVGCKSTLSGEVVYPDIVK